MPGRGRDEIKHLAALAAQISGDPRLGQAVMSGRLSGRETVPLAAGMVMGVVAQIIEPLVDAQYVDHSEPNERPFKIVIGMKDGTVLRIVIDGQENINDGWAPIN